jgi:hypothetical protein
MSADLAGGATGQAGTSPPAEPAAESSEEEAANQTPQQTIVGLYGTSNWLAVDVSRLPRIDEYDAVMSGDSRLTPLDIPSDVKTINYYIATSETGEEPTNDPSVLRGLVRQQMSRAVSSFNSEGGSSDDITGAQVLAEEVTAIEFAYFDGTDWLSDWSSTDYGGLPLAVAIAIQVEMKASRVKALAEATQGADVDRVKSASIHRLVVHLPAARKILPQEPAMTESETSESSETQNAGDPQAQGTPTQTPPPATAPTTPSAPGGFGPPPGNAGGGGNGPRPGNGPPPDGQNGGNPRPGPGGGGPGSGRGGGNQGGPGGGRGGGNQGGGRGGGGGFNRGGGS